MPVAIPHVPCVFLSSKKEYFCGIIKDALIKCNFCVNASDGSQAKESGRATKDWRVAIGKEYDALGIDTHNGNFARLVCETFIDCEGG